MFPEQHLWVKKHYGHEFLFITDYSAEKRAFYHMRDENGVPQGYDLIWRGVEITTGAQREHRYDVLKKQAEEKGLADDVKFYLEFFQYGCPPHGGFGLGIDRLTMLLCGQSIKDAICTSFSYVLLRLNVTWFVPLNSTSIHLIHRLIL